jgi:glucose/arabinose dehydrogenase
VPACYKDDVNAVVRRTILSVLAAGVLVVATLSATRRAREADRESALRAAAAPVVTLQQITAGVGQITSIVDDGTGRLLYVLQTGRVVFSDHGPHTFLDVTSLVSCCGEQGLLSIAFHPRYAENRFFFVNYTNTAGNTVVARYQRSATDPGAADPSTGVILLTITQPFPNHNGGELRFGPDGDLYIGMGDGGSANDPMCNAQNDQSLLGKILRIDVDQNVNTPPFYGIPNDNPFAAPGGPLAEIWAKGLRNPWRFAFDRLTGDLWIGDVGQDQREEVDFQPHASQGGENYGWKLMEGTRCADGGDAGCSFSVPPCNSPTFQAPRYEYTHADGCTVIGGFVYRGTLVPALAGKYVYGDYCSGRLWANGDVLAPTVPQLTTFGEDRNGELYLGTLDGKVYRFVDPNAPTPTSVPTPTATRTPTETPLPPRDVNPIPHRARTPHAVERPVLNPS